MNAKEGRETIPIEIQATFRAFFWVERVGHDHDSSSMNCSEIDRRGGSSGWRRDDPVVPSEDFPAKQQPREIVGQKRIDSSSSDED
jgi:hypothetical protein